MERKETQKKKNIGQKDANGVTDLTNRETDLQMDTFSHISGQNANSGVLVSGATQWK